MRFSSSRIEMSDMRLLSSRGDLSDKRLISSRVEESAELTSNLPQRYRRNFVEKYEDDSEIDNSITSKSNIVLPNAKFKDNNNVDQ
jgi:hypothetical protein